MFPNAPVKVSALQQEPAIWENRWYALNQAINDVLYSFPEKDNHNKEEWQVTLESTLQCLQAFGKKQFEFFQNGFKHGGWLVDSPRYKAEYALRRTLDQIAFDLSVLQRARNQRIEQIQRQSESPLGAGPEVLALADRLAYAALQPAMQNGLLSQETAVITYFQKSPQVRVTPYAPVALIGIPYTCLDVANNARDFLAIPHEVGHHIFWHGKLNDVRLNALLRSMMPAEPAWRANWLEEIFADVYGCLVAGPVIALDFQELLFDNLDLFDDDGEHPISALRPFLYTDTLRVLRDADMNPLYPDAPQQLDELWTTRLDVRETKETFKPTRAETGREISLQQARDQIKETINMILTMLQPALPEQAADIWSGDVYEPGPQLYAQFKTDVLDQLTQAPPRLVATKNELSLGPALKTDDVKWEAGKSSVDWFNLFQSAQETGLKLLPETWNTLLDGGGWAAGGPEGDGNSKG